MAAMAELAAKAPGVPVRLREIAAEQDISESYLEQIFMALRRAGLLESARGAQGGYALARAPETITVGEIVRVLEGPIAPVSCVLEGKHEDCRRSGAADCPTRPVWARLADCMNLILDSVTLADIVVDSGDPDLQGCPDCSCSGVAGDAQSHLRRRTLG